jgi:hypothetical protein
VGRILENRELKEFLEMEERKERKFGKDCMIRRYLLFITHEILL